MPTYKILSVTPMGEKTGMRVTFTDEVNGKPDVTSYHEVESTDETVIAAQLAATALEYENRVEIDSTVANLKTNVAVEVTP